VGVEMVVGVEQLRSTASADDDPKNVRTMRKREARIARALCGRSALDNIRCVPHATGIRPEFEPRRCLMPQHAANL
jgi:hypothetical protein